MKGDKVNFESKMFLSIKRKTGIPNIIFLPFILREKESVSIIITLWELEIPYEMGLS